MKLHIVYYPLYAAYLIKRKFWFGCKYLGPNGYYFNRYNATSFYTLTSAEQKARKLMQKAEKSEKIIKQYES